MDRRKRGGGSSTEDYNKQLGLVGLQLIKLAEMGPDGIGAPPLSSGSRRDRSGTSYTKYDEKAMRRNRSKDGRTLSSYSTLTVETENPLETVITNDKPIGVYMTKSPYGGDHDFFADLVENLPTEGSVGRGTPVSFADAKHEIVDPLFMRFSTFHEEELDEMRLQHHEDTLYYKTMIQSMEEMGDGMSKDGSGIYLSVKRFVRDPLWGLLRSATGSMIDTADLMPSILWGFKQDKSSTDQIIDAINRQTEWHMNNSIDQNMGFWTKLLRQGIIGMPLRAMGDALAERFGVGKTRAQEDEDIKSQGGNPKSDWRGAISKFLYGAQIELKGRKGAGLAGGSFNEKILEFLNVYELLIFDATRRLYVPMAKSIIDFNEHVFPASEKHNRQMAERTYIVTEYMLNELQAIDKHTLLIHADNLRRDEEQEEELKTRQEKEDKLTNKIVKNTDRTADEIKKFRHQSFWQGLLQIGSNLIGKIAGIGAAAWAAVKTLKPVEKLRDMWNLFKGSKFFQGAGKLVDDATNAAKNVYQKGIDVTKDALKYGDRAVKKSLELGKDAVDATTEAVKKIDPMSLKKAIGMPGVGLGVSLGASYLADKVEEGTYAHAALTILDSTASGASVGGFGGMFFGPGGAAIGSIAGGAYGMYSGISDVMTMMEEQKNSAARTTKLVEEGTDYALTVDNLVGKTTNALSAQISNLKNAPIENRAYVEHRGEGMFRSNAVAVQQTVGLSSDAITNTYKDMKAQAEQTLGVIKDQAQYDKEMVELLKAIVNNTKMTDSAKERFSGVQDALVNSMVFGKK